MNLLDVDLAMFAFLAKFDLMMCSFLTLTLLWLIY